MKARSIADLLAEQPLLADLDADSRAVIAGCGRMRHFVADDLVLQMGGHAEEFHLIRSGSVALEIAAPGREPLVIATLGPGELVGASWIIPPFVWAFDVRARSAVRTVGLDAVCLRNKCDADPSLGYALMQRFAALFRDRLQATRLQLLDLYGDDEH